MKTSPIPARKEQNMRNPKSSFILPEELFTKENLYGINTYIPQIYRYQIFRGSAALQHRIGITSVQSIHLIGVYRWPGIHQNDLVEQLNLSKAMVSKTLSQLEELELIVRKMDPKDKRNYCLYLTQKGEDTAKESIRLQLEHAKRILQGVSEEDLEATSRCLRQMLTNLYNIKTEE